MVQLFEVEHTLQLESLQVTLQLARPISTVGALHWQLLLKSLLTVSLQAVHVVTLEEHPLHLKLQVPTAGASAKYSEYLCLLGYPD